MKESGIGQYVEQLLESSLSGIPPSGPHGASIASRVRELNAFECGATRAVIFGGGTGLSTVVGGNSQFEDWPDNPFTGLKQEFPLIHVVVCPTDDGGSTGLLLRQLPLIGIGDQRKLLLSLILRENLQTTYGLDELMTGRLVRIIHRIFNHRFPAECRDFRYVADPLLVVPADLRRACPEALSKLFRSLGAYLASHGQGPSISPGGHCLGNLILTAALFMADGGISHRPPGMKAYQKGLRTLAQAIGVTPDRVHPATATPGQLVLRYSNGVAVRGQNKSAVSRRDFPIERVAVEFAHPPSVSQQLCENIRRADLIVFAPGSLYTSIMPILQLLPLVNAVKQNTGALKILAANFWIQEGETDISRRSKNRGFHVSDLVEAYDLNVPGGSAGLFDVVLCANLEHIPGNVLRNYALEGKRPIYLDRERLQGLGVLPVEATIHSSSRLNLARLIHHDPRKFTHAVRGLLYAHQTFQLKGGSVSAPAAVPPPAGRKHASMHLLCTYQSAADRLLSQKRYAPKHLRRTLSDMVWQNRDIRIDHLKFFRGARIIPAAKWGRSKEWDNVLGYYDPEDGMLRIHEQVADDPERIRDNLLIALGESLLGRYLERRRWIDHAHDGMWGARSYEITLRPARERGCFLTDSELRTYLILSRMVPSPHDARTYRITLNGHEGFFPPGLHFGLFYAWYLNNAYADVMEYEMSILRWTKEKLIPYQREERARKQALVAFFRKVVFQHGET